MRISVETQTWKRFGSISVFVVSLVAIVLLLDRVRRADRFKVQQVEIASLDQQVPPVDPSQLEALAQLGLGKESLFDLDLEPIEQRLESHPWVREVELNKSFPDKLKIGVRYRRAIAIYQKEDGALWYLDRHASVFAPINLAKKVDYPVIDGASVTSPKHLAEAVQLVTLWQQKELAQISELSSISRDSARMNMVAQVIYPILKDRKVSRTWINVGQSFDDQSLAQLERLKSVLQYLAENSIATRHIWLGSDKKIVVRTNRGS